MLFLNISLVKGLLNPSPGLSCEGGVDTNCGNKTEPEYFQTNISPWPNGQFANIPGFRTECLQNQQNAGCADNKMPQQCEPGLSSVVKDQMVMNGIDSQIECLEHYMDNANVNLNNAFSGISGYYGGGSFYDNYLRGMLGYNSNGFHPHDGHHMGYQHVPKSISGRVPGGVPGTNIPVFVKDKITAVVTSVVTSVVERPPVTFIPPPQTSTFTQHAEPITKTLPPLVFQIPTTIFKTAKPETIIRTLPPQIIYQPPEIKTLQQQVHYPPSTIVINKTLNPVTRTVVVPGPERTYVQPPQTVVSVYTKVVAQPSIIPGTMPGISVPGRINPFAPFNHNHTHNMPFSSHSHHPGAGRSSHHGGYNGHYYGADGFNNGLSYPGDNGGYPHSGGYSGNMPNVACDCYEQGKISGSVPGENGPCPCMQQYVPQFNLPALPPGFSTCTINDLADCQRPANNCLNNTNNCYTSMLQSNYNLQSSGDQCGISNVERCESDNWPNVMEPNSSTSTSTTKSPTNKSDKAHEASSEYDTVSASLVSSGKDVPRAVFVSDLTKQSD